MLETQQTERQYQTTVSCDKVVHTSFDCYTNGVLAGKHSRQTSKDVLTNLSCLREEFHLVIETDRCHDAAHLLSIEFPEYLTDTAGTMLQFQRRTFKNSGAERQI